MRVARPPPEVHRLLSLALNRRESLFLLRPQPVERLACLGVVVDAHRGLPFGERGRTLTGLLRQGDSQVVVGVRVVRLNPPRRLPITLIAVSRAVQNPARSLTSCPTIEPFQAVENLVAVAGRGRAQELRKVLLE